MMIGRHISRCGMCGAIAVAALLVAGGNLSAQSDNGNWQTTHVPQVWKNPPGSIYSDGQGVAWFRCRFTAPESWRNQPLQLWAEAADDARQYYLNGHLLGGAGDFPPAYRSGLGGPESFDVPADALRAGADNVLAVRMYLRESRTNFNVAAPVILAGDQAIQLKGEWQWRVGDVPLPQVKQAVATAAFRETLPRDRAADIWKLLDGDQGPLSVTDALARFQLPDDLMIELAVGEPEVRQPLSMKFDARGRLWVVQYLQYPQPAGLTMVSRDKHLRTVWDKIPPPPPHHFRGADKITWHEDTDGDGRFDRHATFVEGLSLVTSFAFDRDGLWVLNPPYLLFYPDRDHDDRPDGDPEVHLQGFGLEDSHSLTNNLRWGPDGWLYASQGSTVTGQIRRWGMEEPPVHSMGQLIWRYHPPTRQYEIFAEGGGNAFGVEIDAAGNLFSGHNGGDTRGFHYVQGGYYQKGFGKHGELSNPFTFGYFPQMAHHSVPRFTHTFVIYEAAALPEAYRGRLYGVAPLLSHVVMSDVDPDGSSFKTKDVGHALTTDDPWFRPVDIQLGPDGALYVCDFYEQRIDHASHYQGRIHRQSGRIYRIRARQSAPQRSEDLTALDTKQLVARLSDPNRSVRQTVQRLLIDGRDAEAVPALRALLETSGQTALEALWVLHSLTGLDDQTCLQTLQHANPLVRQWTVRLTCDDGEISSRINEELKELARNESDLHVRGQLASSARRLPAAGGLPIVAQLLRHDEDAGDIHQPLLLWWAVEAKCETDRELVMALLADRSLWDTKIVKEHLLERLMRRYAASGTRRDLLLCADLLRQAPSSDHAQRLMAGFEKAFEGRLLTNLPAPLVEQLAELSGGSFVLRLRQGDGEALQQALAVIADDKADRAQRTLYMQVLSQIRHQPCVPWLLEVAGKSTDEALRGTALNSLQAFQDAEIATAVIGMHDQLPDDVRSVAQSLLASRPAWAIRFLEALQSGACNRELVSQDVARRLLLHTDPRVGELVQALWGNVQGATTEEMRAAMQQVQDVLHEASGNPYNGKVLFMEHCGKCHVLFNQGGKIGPDLTAFRRDDLPNMLANIINPSLQIREGFENYLIVTLDGRALNGFLTDQDNQTVTVRGADGQSTTIAREDIDEMQAIPRSIMPEGILNQFNEQQMRDLFAYLRATQPVN
jgi:putative membrane-bound dehydrogenase-like protein